MHFKPFLSLLHSNNPLFLRKSRKPCTCRLCLKAGECVLWNLIIAYFISAQINAGFCSKSGRNLKLELLSGVVAGRWG